MHVSKRSFGIILIGNLLPKYSGQLAVPTSPLTSPPPPPPTATLSSFARSNTGTGPPTFAGQPGFSGRPRTNTRVDAPPVPAPGNGLPQLAEGDEALAEDFAAELARGMESLMREIAAGSGSTSEDAGAAPDEAALKAAWEAMLIEGMDGLSASAPTSPETAGAEGDFQSKIRAAMNKVNEGESTLQDASGAGANTAPPPDSLEALLAQLQDLGGGAARGEAGEGDLPTDEAELAGFLESMMGELMSKEVLYDPLKELAEKFPPYLASHSPTSTPPLSPDDRTRYESQLARVRAILAIFDAPTFDEKDDAARERVVGLMAEMQSFGSPPTELMGPLPPGLGALSGEEGCVLC
ncbi:Pex19 protein family-domain-containing protein [Mycena leptocephala]|nr:Pex19 protein family-domain-containing protein [Mycena leptocephala]